MNTEKSKLFKRMGNSLGIKSQKKTHRGYIAKRYMDKVDAFELAEFAKQVPKIELPTRVPIKVGGEVVGYL